uniref:Transmembrane protein 45B n=1 Tax=Varanus komodoensis TaxID=61221 RepID=A0A8D2ITW2_VARKO
MNWQHMTMYLFYGFSGVVDVLMYTPLKLPVGLDRLLVALALFAEGFLFHFHDYQDATLTEHLYSLMSIAIFGAALCAMLEVFLRDHTILELFRASLFILQGSWFWQVGFVLYPPWGGPGWNQADPGNKNFLTMCFFWHYAVGLLSMAVSGFFSTWKSTLGKHICTRLSGKIQFWMLQKLQRLECFLKEQLAMAGQG